MTIDSCPTSVKIRSTATDTEGEVERGRGSLAFVGVTASASSINRLFPIWADELGLTGARLVPFDVPLGADEDTYRRTVLAIRDDDELRGALVTSHKVRLFEAARDLFDELDPLARRLAEVSCISQRDGRLIGLAKDPITAGLAMEAFVPVGHFAGDAHVLCLGAGGSGLAIALRAVERPAEDRPDRVVLVDRDPDRLDDCRRVLGATPTSTHVDYELADGTATADRLLSGLPPGSLVVNATGMGKDLPGMPVSAASRFPRRGIVWEVNYRGELDFLAHAQAQATERELVVEDGWRYFIHGWSENIAEVFGLDLDAAAVGRLGTLAERVRS